jgi:hypothetical protein
MVTPTMAQTGPENWASAFMANSGPVDAKVERSF